MLGVSGSGHMDEGGFEQPISDAERKAKIPGPPELSGADSARQKGPSTVWPLPETLNTFGRDCARLNLILWSSDLTQGSRQRSVEGGPHPHPHPTRSARPTPLRSAGPCARGSVLGARDVPQSFQPRKANLQEPESRASKNVNPHGRKRFP